MQDEVRARLAAVVSGAFDLSRRDGRWLALGDDVVAFAANDETEWRRLQAEHWLIERWRPAGVPVPRVILEDAALGVQVRERMHGLFGSEIHSEQGRSPLFLTETRDLGARLDDGPLSPFGARVAESYGEIAARIRSAVTVSEAAAVGIGVTSRQTLDLDDAIARLHATNASRTTKEAATRLRPWLAALPPADAVIHGDLHFFNMCVAEDGTITGVFDLGDAGIDAAATELLYVQSLSWQFATRVIDAYGAIEIEDVQRAHARAALGHLIWHGPGSERHDGILAWVTAVLERLA